MCGKEKCRKIISSEDWKDPQFQIKYGNHMVSYILEMIKNKEN